MSRQGVTAHQQTDHSQEGECVNCGGNGHEGLDDRTSRCGRDRLVCIKLLEIREVLDLQFALFSHPFQNTVVFDPQEPFNRIFLFQILRTGNVDVFVVESVAIIAADRQCGEGLVCAPIFEISWQPYLMSEVLRFNRPKERVPRLLEFIQDLLRVRTP